MKRNLHIILLGAASLIASSTLLGAGAQTPKPLRPAPSPLTSLGAKQAVASHAPARPAARHPVFVPPPPVIELDEITPVAGLPTALDATNLALYRRIFQEQASGQWAQADAEIAKLTDKTLMGYVGAQRLLAHNYTARYEQLAAWLQDYNDHPEAPAIYKLAVARRTKGGPDLTPASFVSQASLSPSFAAARTVNGADAAQASELRARLEQMSNDGGFNAAFALLDRKTTVDTLGPQEVELWRGRIRTRALEADSQRGVQVPVDISAPPDANWSAGLRRPRAASSWWPMPHPTRPRHGRCLPAPSGPRAPIFSPAIRRNSRPISSAPRSSIALSTAWSRRRSWACASSPTGTCRRSTAP
jgi:soluble lytic murein transglycosylase